MGSSQNVKGVLTAMVTAGVLTELGSTTTATGQTGANAQVVSTTQAVDKFAANLMQNVTNNMASAVVSSAINGTPLNEDTLSTALSSALITAGMAQAANSIGDAASGKNPALNSYTQAVAHALAGCVGGAATTGNSGGCSAGAVGAVVGELSAGYAKSTGATDANALAFAKSMSAVAGALVGGPDGAAAVNLKKNGINVVGQEMVVNGPVGLRRYDIVVQDIFGNLQGIEIKSGGAVKSTYQDFTDRYVNQFGASGAGRLDGKSVTSAITIYVP